jgi:hypothetical protein
VTPKISNAELKKTKGSKRSVGAALAVGQGVAWGVERRRRRRSGGGGGEP